MVVGGQRHAPSDLLARNRTVTHSAGGWVAPPRPVWADGQNLAPTGIRLPDRLTVNRELYSVLAVQTLPSSNSKNKTLDPSPIMLLQTSPRNKAGRDTNL